MLSIFSLWLVAEKKEEKERNEICTIFLSFQEDKIHGNYGFKEIKVWYSNKLKFLSIVLPAFSRVPIGIVFVLLAYWLVNLFGCLLASIKWPTKKKKKLIFHFLTCSAFSWVLSPWSNQGSGSVFVLLACWLINFFWWVYLLHLFPNIFYQSKWCVFVLSLFSFIMYTQVMDVSLCLLLLYSDLF